MEAETPEQIAAREQLKAFSEMTVDNMYEVMGVSDAFELCDDMFLAIEEERDSPIMPGDARTHATTVRKVEKNLS